MNKKAELGRAWLGGAGNIVFLAGLMYLGAAGILGGVVGAEVFDLRWEAHLPKVDFGVEEIEEVLSEQGHVVKRHPGVGAPGDPDGSAIVVALASRSEVRALREEVESLPETWLPEGFSIRVIGGGERHEFWVVAGDPAGLLYGGLELAERLRLFGPAGVTETDQEPHMAMRGTKFNIPLDVRTPSYSDASDAGQHNIAEVWDFGFWREYLDTLARYRFNFVSLWSLHPFPSMVRVPEYPEVALQDVHRSTVDWREHYPLEGTGLDAPEIVNQVEVLRRLSMPEKIAFWRRVMRYGKSRNIDFYIITWNVFVNGTFGKYGITDEWDNPVTRDYFRKSVRQMFLTYPDLQGIGLTTGENMPGAELAEKEDWAFATYAQGVLDATEQMPGRRITFIHRQHQTGAEAIARKFRPLIEHPDIEFLFSFKYAKAHVYSSTRQPYHEGFVREIGPLKTIWTLRNDDVYYFRWGAPDFVREFLQNIPAGVSRGFYLGSDQYIWGREFLSREPTSPRQIEIAKHGYQWMLWGRLGYDPELPNQRWIQILDRRFPSVSGSELFTAWQEASMVYPVTTGFHWGALDFQWYIEACKSRSGPAGTDSGFHDVNRFITLPPHPGTDYLSIPEYVEALVAGRAPRGVTPVEVARRLHAHAFRALERVDRMDPRGDKELRDTLGDIRAMALLGHYYGHKIQGATGLALYRKTRRLSYQQEAVRELNHAAHYWRRYVATAVAQYKNPLWTNRVGYCDWRQLMEEVLKDISIAGGKPRVDSIKPTPTDAGRAPHGGGIGPIPRRSP